jgi:hypothetical protein
METDEPTLATRCLVVPSDEGDLNERGLSNLAVDRGFSVEGLDSDTIEEIVDGVREFADPPDLELMFEAFMYYLRYDAFLPQRGAPPPPSRDEIIRRLDRKFYDALGDESVDEPCREEGCTRGKIANGVFCRRHHFEMVRRKPCPFEC